MEIKGNMYSLNNCRINKSSRNPRRIDRNTFVAEDFVFLIYVKLKQR